MVIANHPCGALDGLAIEAFRTAAQELVASAESGTAHPLDVDFGLHVVELLGRAAERFSDLRPKVGVGVGVRYRSPVGPLRLDLAYGHDIREFRVHFSVGIAL